MAVSDFKIITSKQGLNELRKRYPLRRSTGITQKSLAHIYVGPWVDYMDLLLPFAISRVISKFKPQRLKSYLITRFQDFERGKHPRKIRKRN